MIKKEDVDIIVPKVIKFDEITLFNLCLLEIIKYDMLYSIDIDVLLSLPSSIRGILWPKYIYKFRIIKIIYLKMSFNDICTEIKFYIIKSITTYVDMVNISHINKEWNVVYNDKLIKRYKFKLYIDLISSNDINKCNVLSLLYRYLVDRSPRLTKRSLYSTKRSQCLVKQFCLDVYDNDMNIIFKQRYDLIRYSMYLHLFCSSVSKIICDKCPPGVRDCLDILNKYYDPFELLDRYLTSIVDSMFIFGYNAIICLTLSFCGGYCRNRDRIISKCLNSIISRTITYNECCKLMDVCIHNYTIEMLHEDCRILNYLYENNAITSDIRLKVIYYILNITAQSDEYITIRADMHLIL